MKLFERFFYPGLVTIVLLALMIRCFQLAGASYWLDEFVTVNFASFPRWDALLWDNHPPLYYLLMKGWIRLFGPWEFATRSFSLIFSLATTVSLGLWGRKLKDARLGLLLAFLSMLHPLTFTYAREARMYSLFEFFATLQLWMFWDYYQDSKRWRGLFITSLLLSLTHYFSLPLLLIEAAVLWTWKKRPLISWKQNSLLWIFGWCGLIMLGFFIHQFGWSHLEWQKIKFEIEPQSRWPVQSLLFLNWDSWLGLAATVIIAGLTYRKNELIKLCSVLFLSVFFLSLAVAWSTGRAIFLPRYFIFLTPMVIVTTGLGLFELQTYGKKWLPLTMTILVAGGIIWHLPHLYFNNKAPWRKAAEMIWLSPDSVVYTTRTLAIRSPYFESKNIPLMRIEPEEKGVHQIEQSLKAGKQVWVLENYFGAMMYFSKLHARLSNLQYQVDDFTLTEDDSDPVLLLHVQMPNRQ